MGAATLMTLTPTLAMIAHAMETNVGKEQLSNKINAMRFDAESTIVGIDNRASCCISKRRRMLQFAFFMDVQVHGIVTETTTYSNNALGSNPGRTFTFRILVIPIVTSTPFLGIVVLTLQI